MLAAGEQDVGVYIHFPYCLQKCPYCDFNSHVPRRMGPFTEFVDALLVELDQRLPEAGDRRLASIYFGGGTPSLLPAPAVRRILDKIDSYFGPRRHEHVEITLEANPGTVERGRMDEQKGAGINRISMGVQALDDRLLRQLGRIHDAKEALTALEAIRAAEFSSFSIDLIFAVPGQTREDWSNALRQAISLETPHVSAYNLTYEPGTLMTSWRDRGKLEIVADETEVEMFDETVSAFAAAGLERYEVSNFAQPSHASIHNRLYWQGLPYVGVGPGAHSFRMTEHHGLPLGERKEGRRNPDIYAASWLRGAGEFEFIEQVDASAMAHERAMVGLRTVAGWHAEATEKALLKGSLAAAGEVAAAHPDWCELTNGWLKPTGLGLRLANSLVLSASRALDRHGEVGHKAIFGGRQSQ